MRKADILTKGLNSCYSVQYLAQSAGAVEYTNCLSAEG